MKVIAQFLIFAFLWSCLPVHAQTENRGVGNKPNVSPNTEKRLALVMGNGNYQFTDKLKNPVNDVNDTAEALKKLGFEVISGTDLTLPQMKKLVRDFGTKLQQQKGVGLFYYAGHGVQVAGRNYLIPVDANIETETETPDYSLDSDLILRFMRDAGNEFNMMILDACRNNPFARTWRQYSPNRNFGDDNGLARITPPSGTIILYSTEPGSIASDGTGRNGLFTESFLSQINKPNVEFDALVKLIARDVKQKSGGRQSPWKEGLYDGEFYFKKSEVVAAVTNNQTTEPVITATPKPTPLPTPTQISVSPNIDAEEIYWQEINRRDTKSGYELYLDEYPKGKYAVQANSKIKQFNQDELQKQKDIERSKWREAQNQNTRESYNSYLTAYPNGEFTADARLGIKALESKEEQARWMEAQKVNSKEAYRSYLALYPNGEFASNANSKIREIENKEEQTKWEEVQFLNRKSAYQSYLSAYPNGKNVATARQKIKEFDDEDARKLKEQEKAKEKAKWEEAERLKTVAGYKEYLSIYSNGEFSSLARLRLRDLGEVVTIANRTAGAISNATLPGGAEMNFAYIPAGEFQMGGKKFDDEKPVHTVKITEGFFMGQTEVTQVQWQAVMGNNPSVFKGDNLPVERVSWEDAQRFIDKLNAQNDGYKYRLPTEAEWEYAARAGTTGDYAGNLGSMAWYKKNSGDRTHEVGTKQANVWGVYDMHGNVSEWCQDWFDNYAKNPSVNPTGAGSGSLRVIRGSSWSDVAVGLRSAFRRGVSPSYSAYDLGFRVVRF